jgi:predicted metalloenzyme YecM
MISLEVIASKLDNMTEHLGEMKEHMSNEFEAIKGKQDHTNGRVRSLEIWKSWTIGFAACMTLLVLPLLVYLATGRR